MCSRVAWRTRQSFFPARPFRAKTRSFPKRAELELSRGMGRMARRMRSAKFVRAAESVRRLGLE